MASDIAIRVDNLSKAYKLYDNPVDRLKESIHPFRKKYHRDFYALNNIAFEVKKGESVGIIGKNGSGKSTLLKILTGVLTPTTGRVTVNGKVSSLLELGAGFNFEMTGIENVYFNGTVMGFSKQEMDAKLDVILSFADIGDFIYQPVRTYSSGMFIRLAFAAAISIDPEILIVDEALAVGDMAFQTKCLLKIQDLRKSGVTIVLVSHDTMQVNRVCNRAILLDKGDIKRMGNSEEVVEQYIAENTVQQNQRPRMGTGVAEITQIEICAPTDINNLSCGEKIVFRIHYDAKQKLTRPVFTLGVYLAEGLRISAIDSGYDNIDIDAIEGKGFIDIIIPELLLMPNVYSLNVGIWDSQVEVPYDWIQNALHLTIKGKLVGYGAVYIPHEWNHNGKQLPLKTKHSQEKHRKARDSAPN